MTHYATPFPLLGDRGRAAVMERLRAVLSKWLREWDATECAQSLELTLRRNDAQLLEPSQSFAAPALRARHEEVDVLAIRPGVRFMETLLGLGSSAQNAGGHVSGNVAQAVGEEILRSLAKSLTVELKDIQWEAARTDEVTAVGAWILDVNAGQSDRISHLLSLHMMAEFVARLLPPQLPTGGLERRGASIVDERVRVQALLGETRITVGDLATLAIDDVLLIEGDRATGGFLVNKCGVRMANVALGKANGKRAVQVTAVLGKR